MPSSFPPFISARTLLVEENFITGTWNFIVAQNVCMCVCETWRVCWDNSGVCQTIYVVRHVGERTLRLVHCDPQDCCNPMWSFMAILSLVPLVKHFIEELSYAWALNVSIIELSDMHNALQDITLWVGVSNVFRKQRGTCSAGHNVKGHRNILEQTFEWGNLSDLFVVWTMCTRRRL